jgi:hypothetical protein
MVGMKKKSSFLMEGRVQSPVLSNGAYSGGEGRKRRLGKRLGKTFVDN